MMNRLVLLAIAASFAFAARANELNFGNVTPEGKEIVHLSLRMDADATRIRFAPNYGETVCSPYRKDLCHKEVTLIEVTARPDACTVDGDLVNCFILPFDAPMKVVATLKDGSQIELKETEALFTIDSLTRLDLIQGEKLQRVTKEQLTFEVWGDRADGLDPLVVSAKDRGMFSGHPADTQPVKSSLF